MRLIRCHIENFGRLHDLTVEFERDFHLIREPNGWGKSTLAAFIRVMFFGFEGETKRNGLDNERKRYEPWQGGAFGGEITFETGGRTYTASRIFSNKKVNDAFELRDALTNLKCDDFPENLGEEIFKINGESFERTVFLGQNDCATAATDSINAKIGNLTDNMNDLDSYEKAYFALHDIQNKLTPRSKKGLINRLDDEVLRMQTEVEQGASLEDSIREYGRMESGVRERLVENRSEQEKIRGISGQVSRIQDRSAKRKEYTQLCAACAQTEETCRQAESWFPGEVLSDEELQECMAACDDMERAAEGMRNYELTDEENEQLESLEAGEPGSGTDGEPKEPAADAHSAQQPQVTKVSKRWLVLFICGIALAAAGLAVYFGANRFWPWLAAAAAGVVLIVIGLVLHRADARKDAEAKARAREGQLQMEQMQRELALEREALAREREAQRESLAARRQRYRDSLAQYQERRAFVTEQIQRMGLTPEEPLKLQLQGIWKRRIRLQDAEKSAQEARKNKKEFEDKNDLSFLIAEDPENADRLPSLEELNNLQGKLEDEADGLRDQLDVYERQLTVLREKYDEWTETAKSLEETRRERSLRQSQYDQVSLAMDCLTTAKEAMTAKYMEPLMESFSKYYGILTGEPADRYRMDANTNLTVEEQGMQRETVYLSRGWQDLIGLCLRLALVDAMYPDEKPFLILDDPLVNLDDEKREGGKRLMEVAAQTYQIIYFTCREG